MPSAPAFVEHCTELLAPLGTVRAQRMFGGHGVYVDGLMIGLIAQDLLYLKADATTEPQWRAGGGQPFTYARRQGGAAGTGGMAATTVASLRYWTPPPDAIDSPAALLPWARLAMGAAVRAKAVKATRPARPRRAEPKRSP